MGIFGSSKTQKVQDQRNDEREKKIGLLAAALDAFLENPDADDGMLNVAIWDITRHGRVDPAVLPLIARTINIVAKFRPAIACKFAAEQVWSSNSANYNALLIKKFIELADSLPVDEALSHLYAINIKNSKAPILDQELADKWLALVTALAPPARSVAAAKINTGAKYGYPGKREGLTQLDKAAAMIWAQTVQEIPRGTALKQAFNIKASAVDEEYEPTNKYLVAAAEEYLNRNVQDVSPADFNERFKLG